MAIQNNLTESIKLLGSLLQADKQQEMQREQMSFQANQQAIQNRQQQLMAAIESLRQEKRIAQERDFNVRAKLAELGQTAYDSDASTLLEDVSLSLNEQAKIAEEISNKYEEAYNKNLNILSAFSAGAKFAEGLSVDEMDAYLGSTNKRGYIEQQFKDEVDKRKDKERNAFVEGMMSVINEHSVLGIKHKKQSIELIKEQIKSSQFERLMNQFSLTKNAAEVRSGLVKEINVIGQQIAESVMASNQYGGLYEQTRINAIEDEKLRKEQQAAFESKQEQLVEDAKQVGTRFTSETDYFKGKEDEFAAKIEAYYIDIANKIGSNPQEFVREYKDIVSELDKKFSENKSVDEVLKSEKNLEKRAKIVAFLMNRSLGQSSMDTFETAKRLVKSDLVIEEYLKKAKNENLNSAVGIQEFANNFTNTLYEAYTNESSKINPVLLTNFEFRDSENKSETKIEKTYFIRDKSDYKNAIKEVKILKEKLNDLENEAEILDAYHYVNISSFPFYMKFPYFKKYYNKIDYNYYKKRLETLSKDIERYKKENNIK